MKEIMKKYLKTNTYVIFSALCFITTSAFCAGMEPVWSLAQKEKPLLLETLKQLTAIESGSRELEELDKIASLLASRLRALGGKVELIEAVEADTHRLTDTPEKIGKMVRATFTGSGTKKILLMAHMDTVYPRGMATPQPFKIEGDRAYGLGIADYDGIEQKLRERIKNKLLPEAHVELVFERRFPPLEPKPASRALSAHAQTIYAEIGKKLSVREDATGGFTDAANASLKTQAPVIEGFGLQGFGAHTTNAEYILMSSIEPRLYLATRMIMDIASGKAPLK